MKLLIEEAVQLEHFVLDELNESGASEKNYYIQGTFSTPDKKNRNGRIYSSRLWEDNVNNYQDQIRSNSINTLGELEHPSRVQVDPMKAVMKILELKLENNLVMGKAKILNNNSPETNQIKALIDEGIKIGVSSRGVGKMKGEIVEEFVLSTFDLVNFPSDYNSNLSGIRESLESDVILNESTGHYECTPEGCEIQESKESKELNKTNEETKCSAAAQALIKKLNEYTKEEYIPSKLEIQAYDMYAVFEGKPSYKEIQKKIKETETELNHQKKGSDEYDVLTFELEELKKSLSKVNESKKFDNKKFDKILKKNGAVEIDVTNSDWAMTESKVDAAQKLFIKKLNKATKKTDSASEDLVEVASQIDPQTAQRISASFMEIQEEVQNLEGIIFDDGLHEVMKRKPAPKAGNPIKGAIKNFWRSANELKGWVKEADAHPKIYKQLTKSLDNVADVIDTIEDLD